MDEKDAIKLLEKKVYKNKSNFGSVESFMQHSYSSGKIAEEIAGKLGFNTEEAFLAGYFHDIGRCFAEDKKDNAFHEIVGARYIEKEGIELGITDSREQCNRIAQSARSHFLVYEQFGAEEYRQWLPGLSDTNPTLLLPKSWNELITIYSELTNVNGERISFKNRIEDIKNRDRKNGNPRLKIVEKAESRLFSLRDDLEKALQIGRIDTKYLVL